jgi:hypothetical protein
LPDSPPKKGGRLHRRKDNPQDDSMEVDDEEGQAQPTQTQEAQRTRRSKRR